MSLQHDMRELLQMSETIRAIIKLTNIKASAFIGVAATVPEGAPFPLSAFKGHKVILHNVGFDPESLQITAAVMVPYGGTHITAAKYAGQILRYSINEKWFE